MYARPNLSEQDKDEVARAQRTRITDWEIGKLRAWLVSTASVQDREQIQRAIDNQYGGAS